jgi:hypothetical protein
MRFRLFPEIEIAETIQHVFNLPDIFRPVFTLVADHAGNKF